MNKKKIKNIFLNYENKWVAVSRDGKRIIASGISIKELNRKLEGKKAEDVVLNKVLPFNRAISPQCL